MNNYYEGMDYTDAPYNGIKVYSHKNNTWINEAYKTINILDEVIISGFFDVFSKNELKSLKNLLTTKNKVV